MSSLRTSVLVLALLSLFTVEVYSQVDGSFWWNNKDLLQKASESRNNKKVEFKNEVETEQPLLVASGHDCTCVHQCKCQVAFESAGSSNEGLCQGPDQVCCHIIKLPMPAKCFALEALHQSTTMTPTTTTTPVSSSTTKAHPVTTARTLHEDSIVYPDDDRRVLAQPFLLKLFLRDRRRYKPTRVCGATLISKSSAITAQHCIRGSRSAPDFMIETTDGQIRIVTEVNRHPEYYSGGLFNDLAILRWEDPIRINDQIDIVDLPKDFDVEYSNCSLVAFKAQRNTQELLQISEKANLIDHHTCERRIQGSKWGSRFKLHDNFTCIETNRSASCSPSEENIRDGHPLVCYHQDSSHPILIGIMSWYSCQKSHPDVLTDIRSQMDWISDYNDILYSPNYRNF